MDRILRCVVFDLNPAWNKETVLLKERLAQEGISCIQCHAGEGKADDPVSLVSVLGYIKGQKTGKDLRSEVLILTDSPFSARMLAGEGISYFGCSKNMPADEECGSIDLFGGAALVLEGFDDIDGKYLEEWMLRLRHLPAVIAETKRLIIREMSEQDMDDVIRISRQQKEMTLRDRNVFSPEGLKAYIDTAYRFWGYGLWSVLYNGKLIGCCGFENTGSGDDCAALEMEYMLDTEYQRQGLATEMCQAIIDYAARYLKADEIRLHIHPDNPASIALAEKLGFSPICSVSDPNDLNQGKFLQFRLPLDIIGQVDIERGNKL